MTLKVSTGLRNHQLDGGSLKTALAAGFIRILSGTPPASPDDAETGTLLCILSDNSTGDGLDLGTASAGTISKDPAQVWSGVNAATGTASYFRYVAVGDTAALSTTQKRLQGTCGTVGTDMVMSSVNLTSGAPQTLDACNITQPAT